MLVTTQFTLDGGGVGGLSPTITVVKIIDGTKVIDDVAMTEISSANCIGWYRYNFATYDENVSYVITANANIEEVDDRYPAVTTQEDVIESDIHDGLDSYTNKAEYKATTTISSNMRGTDSANTVIPDNTSITAILTDTNELQTNQSNFATATGFSTPANVADARDNVNANISSLNNISQVEVNAQVDAALADYDAPTRSELTTDVNSIITEVNSNEAKIDSIDTIIDTNVDLWKGQATNLTGVALESKQDIIIAKDNFNSADRIKLTSLENADLSTIAKETTSQNIKTTVDLNLDAKVSSVGGMSEAELHDGLDSYPNKEDFATDTSALATEANATLNTRDIKYTIEDNS